MAGMEFEGVMGEVVESHAGFRVVGVMIEIVEALPFTPPPNPNVGGQIMREDAILGNLVNRGNGIIR